jgi:hypothetical protein
MVVRREPKRPTETALHMAAWSFMRATLPAEIVAFHAANGEQRDPRTAGKLKAMGVLPGVPDFGVLLPKGQMGWIELKVGAGQLSPEQIDFRQRAIALGHGHAVCRSLDEVEAVLTRWLSKFGLTLKGRLAA